MPSAKDTKKGKRRQVQPATYRSSASSLKLGREHFRVVLRRGKRRLPTLELDPLVEHVNWQREGTARTAELNFRRPLDANGADLLLKADVVDLYVAPITSSKWKLVWRMEVDTPSHQIRDGIIAVALKASLHRADQQKVGWKIKAGKRAHTVAQYAAKRFGVPVGTLARGKRKLGKYLKKKATMVDVVKWAYGQEREETGRRFDVDVSRGVLDVEELREPTYMHLMGPAILDATIDHNTTGLATVLTVVSTRKVKGQRKKTKMTVRYVDAARRRRYGWIEKTVKKDGLKSRAEARRWAKKRLARYDRPLKTVNFSHPGIPWLDRGDAIRLYLPEDGLFRVVWITDVRHTLSAGSYEMDVDATVSDPYVDVRKENVKAQKKAVARRRKRARTRGDTHKSKAVKASRRRVAA